MSAKEYLEKLKQTHPKLEKLVYRFYGSGDSFDFFEVVEVLPEELERLDVFKNTNFNDPMGKVLFTVIDNEDIYFDNEGADGTITFDFVDNTVQIDYGYYITEKTQEPIVNYSFENFEKSE